MNLPTKVAFGWNYIEYVYDATGMKIQKNVHLIRRDHQETRTEYAGNYIYKTTVQRSRFGNVIGTRTNLEFFNHPEGYIEPNATGDFDYIYQYKDHLGNVRLSYSDMNKDGVVAPANWTTVFSDGFESASGWDGTGNSWGWPLSTFDSSFKRTGNYSGRIDPTGNANERVCHSNEWVAINNSEPTDYKYSGWVFLENVYPNRAQMVTIAIPSCRCPL